MSTLTSLVLASALSIMPATHAPQIPRSLPPQPAEQMLAAVGYRLRKPEEREYTPPTRRRNGIIPPPDYASSKRTPCYYGRS